MWNLYGRLPGVDAKQPHLTRGTHTGAGYAHNTNRTETHVRIRQSGGNGPDCTHDPVSIHLQHWTDDVHTDPKAKSAEDHRPLNSKAAAGAEAQKLAADLRSTRIVAPPGDEATPIYCPICNESIKSEFLEDDKGWVWKNAIFKDDRARFSLLSFLSS